MDDEPRYRGALGFLTESGNERHRDGFADAVDRDHFVPGGPRFQRNRRRFGPDGGLGGGNLRPPPLKRRLRAFGAHGLVGSPVTLHGVMRRVNGRSKGLPGSVMLGEIG